MIEEIRHLSKVKFICNNEMHYGLIWNKPSSGAEIPPGSVGIIDCVKPTTYIIELKSVSNISIVYDGGQTEYDVYVQQQYEAAQKLSDSLDGVEVGKLLKFPVGDDWSYYVVTKITHKMCTIEWRGFDKQRRVHPRFRWEYKTMICAECLRYIEINEYLQNMLSWNPLKSQ